MLWQPIGWQVLEQLAERPSEALPLGEPPCCAVRVRCSRVGRAAVDALAPMVDDAPNDAVFDAVADDDVMIKTVVASRGRERLKRGAEHVRLHVGEASRKPTRAVTHSSHTDLGYVHGSPFGILKSASPHGVGALGVDDLDEAIADDPETVVWQHRRLLDESGLCLCDGLRWQVVVEGTDCVAYAGCLLAGDAAIGPGASGDLGTTGHGPALCEHAARLPEGDLLGASSQALNDE
jgi:hypothetical protein